MLTQNYVQDSFPYTVFKIPLFWGFQVGGIVTLWYETVLNASLTIRRRANLFGANISANKVSFSLGQDDTLELLSLISLISLINSSESLLFGRTPYKCMFPRHNTICTLIAFNLKF